MDGTAAVPYIDDVRVRGRNQEEHDTMIRKVLEVLGDYGLHANESKLQLSKSHITFLRYDLAAGGFRL